MPTSRWASLVIAPVVVAALSAAGPAHQTTTQRATLRLSAPAYGDLPVGPATTVPWWQRGRLHLGHRVIRTKLDDIYYRAGTTLLASDPYRRDGNPTRWSLVRGSHLVRLPQRTGTDKPLISGNGRWIAWLEVRSPDHGYWRTVHYRAVIYDVSRRRVVNTFRDTRRVGWDDGINGIWLRSISNRGQVFLTQGGRKVWSSHGPPRAFHGPHEKQAEDMDGWPRGAMVYRWHSDKGEFGALRHHGRFERRGAVAQPLGGLWSPGGERFVSTQDESDGTEGHWVQPLAGPRVRLDVPLDIREYGVVGWESPRAVILWLGDDFVHHATWHVIRCRVPSGACERVRHGPRPGSTATMSSRIN